MKIPIESKTSAHTENNSYQPQARELMPFRSVHTWKATLPINQSRVCFRSFSYHIHILELDRRTFGNSSLQQLIFEVAAEPAGHGAQNIQRFTFILGAAWLKLCQHVTLVPLMHPCAHLNISIFFGHYKSFCLSCPAFFDPYQP